MSSASNEGLHEKLSFSRIDFNHLTESNFPFRFSLENNDVHFTRIIISVLSIDAKDSVNKSVNLP